MTIQGVFFDLGGTLFDYPGKRGETFGKFVEQVNTLAGDRAIEVKDIGRAFAAGYQQVGKDYARLDYYLHADMFRDIYKIALRQLELQFDAELYEEYDNFQHETIVTSMALKEDCLATLSELKVRGLYCSIVSNIDELMLQQLVERAGLASHLDHWTSSEAAGFCKPHRGFFDISLEKSGLRAEQVLFVGDSPEHDINGAKPLGFRTALIRNGDGAPPLQSGAQVLQPHHTIRALDELLAIV